MQCLKDSDGPRPAPALPAPSGLPRPRPHPNPTAIPRPLQSVSQSLLGIPPPSVSRCEFPQPELSELRETCTS